MSGTFHLNSNHVSGYTLSDGKCFSNSAVFSRTPATLPCFSCRDHKLNGRLKCTHDSSSFVCRASSGSYRRNPDFSRLNKHGFRGRNREGEDRDEFDGENSEMLSLRNGSLLSLSNSPKFQATSSPGPGEKEIVELFRKVQAQLRAGAAAKREDRKLEEKEASKGQGKESETVDSLLKLLRKHSGEQSKKIKSFSSHGDNYVDRQDRSSGNLVKSWSKDHNASSSFTRPTSSFRRKSPVPRFESPTTYSSSEATFDEASSYSVTWTHNKDTVKSRDEPEDESQSDIEPEYDEHAPEYESEPGPVTAIPQLEPELQLDASSVYQEEDDNVTSDALSDDNDEFLDDADEEVEEEAVKDKDLSTLKLMELRGIAKSRGLKGLSKMKKAQLVELLGSDAS